MSRASLGLSEELLDYLRSHNPPEHPVQTELRVLTGAMKEAAMQISPEQGAFMQLLVRLLGVKRYLEIGVFTGYSALSVALVMPEDGHVDAFDISEEWTAIGKKHWEKAGVDSKITLHIGPAAKNLDALKTSTGRPEYDMAFIDADKTNYHTYYEHCLDLIRPGGLILIDNVLWSGDVINNDKQDEDVKAIRNINTVVAGDTRVDSVMIPLSDGIMMVRKRRQ